MSMGRQAAQTMLNLGQRGKHSPKRRRAPVKQLSKSISRKREPLTKSSRKSPTKRRRVTSNS